MDTIIRTNSENLHFHSLIKLLDAELKSRDTSNFNFYNQFNKLDDIKNVVIAYNNETPVGCGAFKIYQNATVEIKRMYVLPLARNKGVASKILNELEMWAAECGFKKCILETGVQQKEAIELYKKRGFTLTSNFGMYENVENSVCFEKYID